MDVIVEHRDGVIVLKLSGRIVGVAGGELRKVIEEQLQSVSGSPNFYLILPMYPGWIVPESER